MKLYYKGTDREVKIGDELTDFRGDKTHAYYWREPTHGVGKITVKDDMSQTYSSGEFYVSVYGLEWRGMPKFERELLNDAVYILNKYGKKEIANYITEFLMETEDEE